MTNYLDTLNDEIREYYSILCPEFPEWIVDYINVYDKTKISVRKSN